MEEKKKGRGGARAGAGSKRWGKEKRVRLFCTVTPETLTKLETLKARGYNIGLIIDELVKGL